MFDKKMLQERCTMEKRLNLGLKGAQPNGETQGCGACWEKSKCFTAAVPNNN